MVTYAEGLRRGVRNALCAWLNADGNPSSWLQRRYVIPFGGPAEWARRQICDNNSPEEVAPPFEGGQCNVPYRVQFTFTGVNNLCSPIDLATSRTLTGPITEITVEDIEDSQVKGWAFTARNASGTVENYQRTFFKSSFSQPCSVFPVLGGPNLIRVDGQPDTCGDPPPEASPFPPGGVTVPITIEYENNEGDTIVELGDLTFNVPVFAPVGIVNAPITINTPDLNLEGTVEISPEFNVEVTPQGGDKSPGDAPEPTNPEPPDDVPSVPEDDANSTLIGVYVRSIQGTGTSQTEIFQENTPDLYVPRLGNLYFRTRNSGVLGWYGPIDIKTTSAFFPAPENTIALYASVDWERGWSGEVIPVRSAD